MKLEKVYDELYGMIEDLKKKIAALSGGDEVTITPALDSGTKIADYAIGETEGSLFAPTPATPVGIAFSSTETEVGSIDGTPLYSRIFTGSWQQTESGIKWLTTDIKAATEGIDKLYAGFMSTADNILSQAIELYVGAGGYVRLTTVSARTYTKVYLLYTKPAPEPENNARIGGKNNG